jgi:hypothetical protein
MKHESRKRTWYKAFVDFTDFFLKKSQNLGSDNPMILPGFHIFSLIRPAKTREITGFFAAKIADSLIRRGFADGRIGADSQEYQLATIPRSLSLELVRHLTTCDLTRGQKDELEHPDLDSR